jgi:mRNA-degrading endonuclease RelE of RelBE toxin-antitoxin system
MIFVRSKRFKQAFRSLPKEIQKKAARALRLLAAASPQGEDPIYPSLVVKKVRGYSDVWEARVDLKYRLTFQYERADGETICILRNVDNHDECLNNP